ncbi:hypothetical protein CEXT_254381 [Caerostris extrusa]|uniref:Uncharacterized protein n=1 Tax=Caerostris extrusa TaxID=172846 RepID=A0AAV4SBE7_CAEEX|nr:hypothetical protein CEXT_254381 [Caerostris extrusa]
MMNCIKCDKFIEFNEKVFNQALICLEKQMLNNRQSNVSQTRNASTPRNGIDALNSDILKEKSYNADNYCNTSLKNKPLLIEIQKQAYDFIMNHVNRGISRVIDLDAAGSIGKTIFDKFNIRLKYEEKPAFTWSH